MWIKVGNNLYDASACSIKTVPQYVMPGRFAIRIEPYVSAINGMYETVVFGLNEGRAGEALRAIEDSIVLGHALCDLTGFAQNKEDE